MELSQEQKSILLELLQEMADRALILATDDFCEDKDEQRAVLRNAKDLLNRTNAAFGTQYTGDEIGLNNK